MKSRVYHGGQPETRHYIAEGMDEAAVGIRKDLFF
jgi:hypothetical protein